MLNIKNHWPYCALKACHKTVAHVYSCSWQNNLVFWFLLLLRLSVLGSSVSCQRWSSSLRGGDVNQKTSYPVINHLHLLLISYVLKLMTELMMFTCGITSLLCLNTPISVATAVVVHAGIRWTIKGKELSRAGYHLTCICRSKTCNDLIRAVNRRHSVPSSGTSATDGPIPNSSAEFTAPHRPCFASEQDGFITLCFPVANWVLIGLTLPPCGLPLICPTCADAYLSLPEWLKAGLAYGLVQGSDARPHRTK